MRKLKAINLSGCLLNRLLLFGPILFAAVSLAACQAAPTASVAEPVVVSTPSKQFRGEEVLVASNGMEVVCRSISETGTRFSKRICKTPDAWLEYDSYTNQNAKESTDKFQRLNSGCKASGKPCTLGE
jgi:hypothetical protein